MMTVNHLRRIADRREALQDLHRFKPFHGARSRPATCSDRSARSAPTSMAASADVLVRRRGVAVDLDADDGL